jgi:glycerophosphoryl diester phosphodiesterase
MSRARWVLSGALLLIVLVYLNNTTLLAPASSGRPVLLAHRGMHQTFSHVGLKGDTCTAARIFTPEHAFLENTLDSMRAAFAAGADVVELDVHPTVDGHFAVFHDWTLDCRTNGTGVTRTRTLAELKALDIGHGYTADGGATYPFRGKGVGLMPSLDEVLAAFPDKRFLIDIKGNEPGDGRALAERLAQLPAHQRSLIMAYGRDGPIEALRAAMPEVKVMTRAGLKRCLLTYIGVGWTGWVPTACRNAVLIVPATHAHWLWGWPNRFLQRMRAAGTEVFALGPWEGEEFTRGLDDAASYGLLPRGYDGGIWTNRIDRIAPLAASSK